MLRNLILLSVLLILTITAGCSGHSEEYPWIYYRVEYPKHIVMTVEHDGKVYRGVQSGPAKGLIVPLKNTEFHLKPYEVDYLKRIIKPSSPDIYVQQTRRGESFMVIELDGLHHVTLPKKEDLIENEEAKTVVRFFKQLEIRKAQ